MKYSEFKRWLKQQGCSFLEGKGHGKGSHLTVLYKERKTTLPFHASKEISEGLRRAIIKQLGI